MTRKRPSSATPREAPAPQGTGEQRRPSTFLAAARQYFSGGLGLRANLVLGSIALIGLLVFVATSLAGPINDEDAPPGPTTFPTATPGG